MQVKYIIAIIVVLLVTIALTFAILVNRYNRDATALAPLQTHLV